MAEERQKPTQNYGKVSMGVSNDANLEPRMLRVDASTGRLLVDASVTVSGLPTAVTDGEAVDVADTGNLALGTDGSNYQVLHTDSSGDLQIDILSSALPSGASTSAKQDTIIGHVDGIEGLLTTIDADTGNIATSVASIDTKTPSLGQALAAASVPVVLTAAQLSTLTPLSTVAVTQSGTWDEVGINDSGNSITVDAPVGTPVFVRLSDGSSAISTLPVSLASVPSHAVTNAGTFAVQVDGSALTSLQLIDDVIFTDDNAFTPATSKVAMAGFQADESSTDSVDEGDAGAARMTLDRKVIVTSQPHTAGGLSTAMFTGSDGSSILTNAAQVIKASAGQVYGYYIYNPNSSATFVHFYNTAAASVTVGTTNPLFSLTIPATSAANLALPYGITFTNAGFSISATTTAGGNSAPSTGLDAIVWYT